MRLVFWLAVVSLAGRRPPTSYSAIIASASTPSSAPGAQARPSPLAARRQPRGFPLPAQAEHFVPLLSALSRVKPRVPARTARRCASNAPPSDARPGRAKTSASPQCSGGRRSTICPSTWVRLRAVTGGLGKAGAAACALVKSALVKTQLIPGPEAVAHKVMNPCSSSSERSIVGISQAPHQGKEVGQRHRHKQRRHQNQIDRGSHLPLHGGVGPL